MKLYQLPRNTKFRIIGDESKEVFKLFNIDGMYSFCHNSEKEVVHIGASTEVERVEDVQKMA